MRCYRPKFKLETRKSIKLTSQLFRCFAGFLDDYETRVLLNVEIYNYRYSELLSFGSDSKHDEDRRNLFVQRTADEITTVR